MMDAHEREYFITLFEPLKKVLNEKQWEWFLGRGDLFSDHITKGKLSPRLLRQMRTAQNKYFKTRSGMPQAKALEAAVDKLLEAAPEVPTVEQQKLF